MQEEKLGLLEMKDELEEFHAQLNETFDETRRQLFQAKIAQWVRRTTMSKDISRMESLESEFLRIYIINSNSKHLNVGP